MNFTTAKLKIAANTECSSSVERSVRDREVEGSIPSTPTKREKEFEKVEALRAPPPAALPNVSARNGFALSKTTKENAKILKNNFNTLKAQPVKSARIAFSPSDCAIKKRNSFLLTSL